MNTLFKLLSMYYLVRAVLGGPVYLARFLLRRQVRRVVNRQIRKL